MTPQTPKDSEFQGITRLLTAATLEVTDLVAAAHHRMLYPPLLPATPIQHLIGMFANAAYSSVRWSTQLIGGSLDKALGRLAPVLGDLQKTKETEAIRGALNGVLGDYLEKQQNPLAIQMQFRYGLQSMTPDAQAIAKTYEKLNGKLLLMVHGSCMTDAQWTQKDHNHGEALAKELNKTPLYLHYNSGRHISANGRELNESLEALINNWPVPVEELHIVAHSMGGLVVRSALYYAQQTQHQWPKSLKKIIFLGTPHHGAPLERIGNYLDLVLESVPYTKPFARLGKIRSAGITDLRYGNLIDEDWRGHNRFTLRGDQCQHIPLPEGIDCYQVVAVLGKTTDSGASKLVGDGLVTVNSALGQHSDAAKSLTYDAEKTFMAYETSHMDLLSDPVVYGTLKQWFTDH